VIARAAAFLVLGLAFAVSACNDGGDDAATPSPATTPSSSAESALAACDGVATAAGDTVETITVEGVERSYILRVPPQYDGTAPLPLVLNFHGFGSNARQQAAYSRLPAKGDAEGFVVVSPDGGGPPGQQQWNSRRFADLPDDVAFVEALLDRLTAGLCIDTARVYAVGMSSGANFSQRLACELPDRIAGVAAIAATFYPVDCASRRPVPVIAFHGTADTCVPYEGGPVTCGRGTGGIPVPSTEFGAARWAAHNACNAAPSQTQLTANVRAIAYSECRENVAVILYTVEGGGHTWPGAIDVPRLGPTTREIDATDLLWEFFEGQAQ
jgi:polyhydroxybutyrate depolymerase